MQTDTTALPITPLSPTGSMAPDPDEVLATGWEAHLPVGDTIVRNYVATLEDRLATIAAATGAPTRSTDDAFLVDLASAYVFDNLVVLRGPLERDRIVAVLAEARDFFPPERTWTLQTTSPGRDLSDQGLVLLGHPPLMYRAATSESPTGAADLEIRRVRGSGDLADFERTLVAAYPLPPGSAVVDPSVLDAEFHAFVGYVDGQPVATAGAHAAHGLTEVEWVSTLPGHRRRGHGAALTLAAANAAPGQPAVLVATDDGRPVYERLGFLPLQRMSVWLNPATA